MDEVDDASRRSRSRLRTSVRRAGASLRSRQRFGQFRGHLVHADLAVDERAHVALDRNTGIAQRRIQSLRALRDEMKAVARGERPAPRDAARPSFNSVEAVIRRGVVIC